MNTAPILTRADLHNANCEVPGCAHTDHSELFLSPICHDEGVEAAYIHASGTLRLTCVVCKKLVAYVQVAESQGKERAAVEQLTGHDHRPARSRDAAAASPHPH